MELISGKWKRVIFIGTIIIGMLVSILATLTSLVDIDSTAGLPISMILSAGLFFSLIGIFIGFRKWKKVIIICAGIGGVLGGIYGFLGSAALTDSTPGLPVSVSLSFGLLFCFLGAFIGFCFPFCIGIINRIVYKYNLLIKIITNVIAVIIAVGLVYFFSVALGYLGTRLLNHF